MYLQKDCVRLTALLVNNLETVCRDHKTTL